MRVISSFGFRLDLVDEFTEIVMSTFGHHPGLFSNVKIIY